MRARILRLLTLAASTAVGAVIGTGAAPVHAAVDDFSYSSWHAVHELTLDEQGRAQLVVTETVVAEFPDFDQNRGIVRGVPTQYAGANVQSEVISVEDGEGDSVAFETNEDEGVLSVSIGGDDFVHGAQTYVIVYRMTDVIHVPSDANIDEFFWDLVPFDRAQAIDAFSAAVVFGESFAGTFTGDAACYVGTDGDSDACAMSAPDPAAVPTIFEIDELQLDPNEGVSVAIGLEPGTVTQPLARQPNPATDIAPFFALIPGVALLAAGFALRQREARRRRTARGIVVPQYEVPATMPPLLAGEVLERRTHAVPAEIVHLALGGAVRIEDANDEVQLRVLDPDAAHDPLDRRTLDAVTVGSAPSVPIDLSEPDDDRAAAVTALAPAAVEEAAERGLTTKVRSVPTTVLAVLAMVSLAAGVAVALWGAIEGRTAATIALVLLALALLATLFLSLFLIPKFTVLTPAGAEQYEYLQGVRDYLALAERDRIQMLQSYSGAERRADGSANVVVLFERLLPYAMLFGLEREWGDALAQVYARERVQPGWYVGVTPALLASRISALSTTATPRPAATSSSGLAGSMGGGFAGGGGGGGFSGGR